MLLGDELRNLGAVRLGGGLRRGTWEEGGGGERWPLTGQPAVVERPLLGSWAGGNVECSAGAVLFGGCISGSHPLLGPETPRRTKGHGASCWLSWWWSCIHADRPLPRRCSPSLPTTTPANTTPPPPSSCPRLARSWPSSARTPRPTSPRPPLPSSKLHTVRYT